MRCVLTNRWSQAIQQADPKQTEETVQNMIEFADKNGDNEIDFEEFKIVRHSDEWRGSMGRIADPKVACGVERARGALWSSCTTVTSRDPSVRCPPIAPQPLSSS